MTTDPLTQLRRRRRLNIIGLMSGTSADSIDAALIEATGHGPGVGFRRLAFHSAKFPKGARDAIMKQSDPRTSSVDGITRLHFLLAEWFASAANRVARAAGKTLSDVHLIGSHGQTIHHLPEPTAMFGRPVRGTLQIGSHAVIAQRTGVITVGDFRSADIGAGGTGAPLVPFFDYLMFRSRRRTLALLNVGGIANITVLPANCGMEDVVAFDTGPGNMIIDALSRELFGRAFDRDGAIAGRGEIIPDLLAVMMRHPYFNKRPPKSTGRELYGSAAVKEFLRFRASHRPEDLMATATELTALSVYDQYLRFIRRRAPLDELIVSGGGAKNRALLDALARYFAPAAVVTSSRFGIDPQEKEAICFALLANETIRISPSNIPAATGAKRPAILGTIALPSPDQ